MFSSSSSSIDTTHAKCNCAAGTTWTGSACENCEAGSYSLAKSSWCTLCGVGKYQTTTGATSCDSCEAGTFSDTTGRSTVCSDLCALGTYSASGASSCTNCTAGFFQNSTGSANCKSCPAGQSQSVPGQDTCSLCEVGMHAPTPSTDICTNCPTGYYQDETGASSCKSCGVGQYTEIEGKSSCSYCGAGRYSNATALDEECYLDCPAGQYSSTGDRKCTDCSSGQYQSKSGQSTCDTCEDGEISNAGASHCKNCGVTPSCAVAGAWLNCSDSDYDANCYQNCTCVQCAAGRASSTAIATDSSTCEICGAGQIAASAGTASCTSCTAGQYATDSSTDTGGGLVSQVLTGATSCNDCPVGYYADTSSTIVCKQCSSIEYSYVGASECTLCAADYFNDPFIDDDDEHCSLCPSTGTACDTDGTATLGTLPIARHYWRISNESTDILECKPLPHGCAGGANFTDSGNGYCFPGYEGCVQVSVHFV